MLNLVGTPRKNKNTNERKLHLDCKARLTAQWPPECTERLILLGHTMLSRTEVGKTSEYSASQSRTMPRLEFVSSVMHTEGQMTLLYKVTSPPESSSLHLHHLSYS